MIYTEKDCASQHRDESSDPASSVLEGRHSEKPLWIKRIPPELYFFGFFLLVSVYLTWPISAHFTRSVYGFPSDNLGQLWQWWWYRSASSFGAKASFSPLIGFPFGQGLPTISAEFIVNYGARFLILFLTPTVVNNLFITSSFLLSGVTMYYLVRHIARDRAVAFFGGIAFLLCTFHTIQATYSVHLAMTQWMPLFILALLLFMERPSPRNAMFLFGSGLLVLGTSVHYGFFMAVFTLSFLLAHFTYKRLRSRRQARMAYGSGSPVVLNKRTLALVLMGMLAIVVIVLPLFFASQRQINKAGNWPTRVSPGSSRNLNTSAAGAAPPIAYLLPNSENRFLGWITRRLITGRVSFYTNSLYLGLSVLAPAIFALVIMCRRSRSDDRELESPASQETPVIKRTRMDPPENERAIAWGLLFAAAVAFVLSMPPYMHIGSTRIWLPSMVLRYIVPWLRWCMRFGAVVALCAILLASLGLAWLRRSRGHRWTLALIAFLSVFLFLETTIVPPFKYFESDSRLPGVFAHVASMEIPGGIVIYPAFEPGFFNSQRYMHYQQGFKKPMLNGGIDNSDGEALRRSVYNPFNPDTPGILSRMGISRVVYLDNLFEQYEGSKKAEEEVTLLPPGLQLEKRFRSYDLFGSGYIFKVTAPKVYLMPIYQGDITVPHIDEGLVTVRLMERDGIIRIINYTSNAVTASLKIPISNLAFKHSVALTQNGKVLWKGELADGESTVIEVPRLAVPEGGTELHLVVGGTGLILSDEEAGVFGTEIATLRIGDVDVEPVTP